MAARVRATELGCGSRFTPHSCADEEDRGVVDPMSHHYSGMIRWDRSVLHRSSERHPCGHPARRKTLRSLHSIARLDSNKTAWSSCNSIAFNAKIVSSCFRPENWEHLTMTCTMKAAVLESYGTPLRVTDVLRPQPSRGEVLVRIAASGVNPLDTKIFDGVAAHADHPPPAILGLDMTGTVEAVGPGVTRYRRGDEVYGMTGGVGGRQGSLAEFAAVDADLVALKP